MKKFLIFIGTVAIIALLTKPSSSEHKEILKLKFKTHLQQAGSLSSADFWKKTGKALGHLFGGVVIDELVDKLIVTEDYGFFSVSTINWAGESKVIGIGAFGNVFLTDELDNALSEGLID